LDNNIDYKLTEENDKVNRAGLIDNSPEGRIID